MTDKECGTNYQERLKKWIIESQKKGFVVAGALTDAKGDRAMRPSQQSNPDSNVHIREVRSDGIVISGYKAMICGVAASNEIFILPAAAIVKKIRITQSHAWYPGTSRALPWLKHAARAIHGNWKKAGTFRIPALPRHT